MGAIKLMTAIVFSMIFAIAIINFNFGFAQDNTAPVNLLNDSEFTNLETTVQGNFSTINTDIESTKKAIFNISTAPASESSKTPGAFTLAWGGGKDALSIIADTVNVKILGGKGTDSPFSIVPTMFMALFVFLVSMFVIKLWRAGNPD